MEDYLVIGFCKRLNISYSRAIVSVLEVPGQNVLAKKKRSDISIFGRT